MRSHHPQSISERKVTTVLRRPQTKTGKNHLGGLDSCLPRCCVSLIALSYRDLFGAFEASTGSAVPSGPLKTAEILRRPSLPRKCGAKCVVLSDPSKGFFSFQTLVIVPIRESLLVFITLSFLPPILLTAPRSLAEDFFLTVLRYFSFTVYELLFPDDGETSFSLTISPNSSVAFQTA